MFRLQCLGEFGFAPGALSGVDFRPTTYQHLNDSGIYDRIILQSVQPDARATLSVIVVNWNRAELLRCCLRSLAGQIGVDFEIVIVDNGSTDDSLRVIGEFKRSSSIPVQVIRNEVNRGFCAANNQGIQAACGEYIALLNNDAEAE